MIGAIRWYMKGQHIGKRPVFDGVCSYCGLLLYGALHSGHCNKKTGAPKKIDGSAAGDATQPPFLLRWAPAFFAEMLPDVFAWNANNNKLSLKREHIGSPPWKSSMHHNQVDRTATWLYCEPCHDRLFQSRGRDVGHIPFRDRASTQNLREPAAATRPLTNATRVEMPVEARMSTPQERSKWTRARNRFARRNINRRSQLNLTNLVPQPDDSLWQHAPEIPFHELRSEDSKGHLSCCNLQSSMKTQQDERGRSAYACSAGETSFWKRQPNQLSSTLAFMLGRDEGKFFHLRAAELEPLKGCLRWLRENNPHLRLFWSNAERFAAMYEQLQAVVPRGRGDTTIRIHRTQQVQDAVESTIDSTLGSECAVLVVVDPVSLPKSWCSVDLFSEQIGDAEYRVSQRDVPKTTGKTDASEQETPPTCMNLDAESLSLPSEWGCKMRDVSSDLRRSARVTLGDMHLDAKLFPHLHPYGSGSFRSEEHTPGMQRYASSRLLSLERVVCVCPKFFSNKRKPRHHVSRKQSDYVDSAETCSACRRDAESCECGDIARQPRTQAKSRGGDVGRAPGRPRRRRCIPSTRQLRRALRTRGPAPYT